MSLHSGDWWRPVLGLDEMGTLHCCKADVGEMWIWKYTAAFPPESGKPGHGIVLQGMRKTERAARRHALSETARYLGAKLKLLGKVKP